MLSKRTGHKLKDKNYLKKGRLVFYFNQMFSIPVDPIGNINIDLVPHICPFCHRAIEPIIKYAHTADDLQLFMACPNISCKNSFIAYYEIYNNGFYYTHTSKGRITSAEFNNIINEISPSFVIIYNQAFYAEQEKLFEICGVGYRKALEFLIKDYLIIKEPSNKESIEKLLLGKCIDEKITDSNIKSVSKRAVWLGNDETHYIKKWEGKNLNDLKKLIQLTVHWIEMEALTKSFEEDMPA